MSAVEPVGRSKGSSRDDSGGEKYLVEAEIAEILHSTSEVAGEGAREQILLRALIDSDGEDELREIVDASSIRARVPEGLPVSGAPGGSSRAPVEFDSGELERTLVGLLRGAAHDARRNKVPIGRRHLLAAMLDQSGDAAAVLEAAGASRAALLGQERRELNREIGRPTMIRGVRALTPTSDSGGGVQTEDWQPAKLPPYLSRFGHDLTELASVGGLDPMIGRASELRRAIAILSRRTKNNAVLIGEPGVGKTAIVEGLAKRIVDGNVSERLRHCRVVALDMGALVGGAKFRGDFEDRVKELVSELRDSGGQIILFIDELHTVVGAGASEGSLDASNLLKPVLGRGEVRMVGATTIDEFRKNLERDPALERRFQPVMVAEPSSAETVRILRGIKHNYEQFHDVEISDDAVEIAVTLSQRYIADRFLPDKAIDVLDEAAARLDPDADTTRLITGAEAADVVGEWTGVPVARLLEGEAEKLALMEDRVRQRVVGQDGAIASISNAVRNARAGLANPDRPIGTFLFFGHPGVGKTHLARAVAHFLFDSDDALVRIDLSEYPDRSSITRLIGAPPGFVGYEESGQLTEAVRRRPYSVVLLDEIDKAGPEVLNLLLQALSDGRLTDGKGRTVDFKNTLMVLTSNLTEGEALREAFPAEFLDRIDEIIEFSPLGKNELEQILMLEIAPVVERAAEQDVQLIVTSEAVSQLASMGIAQDSGARALGRLIEGTIITPLSKRLLSREIQPGDAVSLEAGPESELTLRTLKDP